MRTEYWSCSPLADLIRGTRKPQVLEVSAWDTWEVNAKRAHPLRYWIAEEFLDKAQDVLTAPFKAARSVRYYINNRFSTKTHCLESTLPRGQWYDMDTRILHCLFDELVNFVEQEQAWMTFVFDTEKKKKQGWRKYWRSSWRDPAAGMEYLDWAASLKFGEDWGVEPDDPRYGHPTAQAQNAQEVKELYTWWKYTRPSRPDAYDASGWTELTDSLEEKYGSMFDQKRTDAEDKMVDDAGKRLSQIEQEYEDEDERMLIRLIKVRKYLWT